MIQTEYPFLFFYVGFALFAWVIPGVIALRGVKRLSHKWRFEKSFMFFFSMIRSRSGGGLEVPIKGSKEMMDPFDYLHDDKEDAKIFKKWQKYFQIMSAASAVIFAIIYMNLVK